MCFGWTNESCHQLTTVDGKNDLNEFADMKILYDNMTISYVATMIYSKTFFFSKLKSAENQKSIFLPNLYVLKIFPVHVVESVKYLAVHSKRQPNIILVT